MDYAERTRVVGDVLALTDMEGRRNDMLKGLSRGMQQRISLARVLVHDPALLFLDEPASGLDPRARIELMDILQELRRIGKTIFISSHILSELALLCDSVTILDRGAVRYSGPMSGLSQSDGETADYMLTLAEENTGIEEALRKVAGVLNVSKPGKIPQYRISFHRTETDPNAVLSAALGCGARIIGFQEVLRHLNQAFMDLTEPGVPPVITLAEDESTIPPTATPGEPG
jgi:ABC-2 type transport system ATP-binding protein